MAQKIIRYEVTGFGDFPVDMLRYDGVYPASEKDSGIIINSHESRTVEVEGRGCTVRRWDSFLWRVEPPYPVGARVDH